MAEHLKGCASEGLQRRNVGSKLVSDEEKPKKDTPSTQNEKQNHDSSVKLENGTYWLTRIVLLRYLGFVYCVAFLVALHQNGALLGSNGLLPTDKYLDKIDKHVSGRWMEKLQHAPTLLWFMDYKHNLNSLLDYLALAGLALAAFITLFGCANIILLIFLWLIYHSIVNIGQRWYSFGWESQLLETGFLAAFLCPLLTVKRLPKGTPTPAVAIWGYRWLIFRIMLGAGLIKIRGDKCWKDLTCMFYHYETQPVPNPISYYMHQSPQVFHKFETLSNHFVELVAPFFLVPFMPRRLRMIGGFIQILFQVVLIISGNLSFLNWLTIVPSLACFDDASLAWMFSGARGATKWQVGEIQKENENKKKKNKRWWEHLRGRHLFDLLLATCLIYLSVPIVQNLMSQQQVMNTSFDPLRIVNTYGAFGSITKERTEVIFQGTYGDPSDEKTKWQEYEFKCKPGGVKRRPCLISPYHYRLDWLMWFSAFQSYQHNPWLVHLAAKLMVNDPATLSLIAHNPFDNQSPPKWIRAEHYQYSYTKIGSRAAQNGAWWKRKHIGNYLPPVSLHTLKDYMKNMGWSTPRLPPKPSKKKATKV